MWFRLNTLPLKESTDVLAVQGLEVIRGSHPSWSFRQWSHTLTHNAECFLESPCEQLTGRAEDRTSGFESASWDKHFTDLTNTFLFL